MDDMLLNREAIPGAVGQWVGEPDAVSFGAVAADAVLRSMRQSVSVVHDPVGRRQGLAFGGGPSGAGTAYPLLGILPALYPEWLGDRRFTESHGLRFAYVGGSMARGIASTDLVIALADMGALGMFGAAGLPVAEVEAAIDCMSVALDGRGLPWGCNLIHSPGEAGLEDHLVDLYLRRGVRRIEASAFMRLTKAVVRLACTGLRAGPGGEVLRARSLFAKVSREEVAEFFLSPPPQAMLAALRAEGALSAEEAELAARIPVADHIIVESDSGGHTDNRPLGGLFPVIVRLRDDLARRFGYAQIVHVGAAGGLGAPEAVAAAYAMGAAFVVLGSVHQAAIEAGVSDEARAMLAKAGPADVAMTASADMFEMGVKVQVLTRGTLMAARANQLYQLYKAHDGIDDIPQAIRAKLESDVFRMPLDEVWSRTRAFFASDPAQIARAQAEPKHRMALIFRWYLGNSSRWPIVGEPERRADYQLWCGPAMGAFNRWTAGSFLEAPQERRVRQIALNLLEGAAVVTRAHQLRTFGLDVPGAAFDYRPESLRA
jgi:trans-AT polyketide synthase/acyltransferase/oxidoreductase domain-containing protein